MIEENKRNKVKEGRKEIDKSIGFIRLDGLMWIMRFDFWTHGWLVFIGIFISCCLSFQLSYLCQGKVFFVFIIRNILFYSCLLYTSPSPRDLSTSRMPSSA